MIEITEVIKQMKQGQTTPYLCKASDGNRYIVKGQNTTYRGLIHEWVCVQLAQKLGLPVPDYDVAYVDDALLRYGNYDLQAGDWFASRFEENIQDVPFERLPSLDAEQLKLLFVFDYWIQNDDRNLTLRGGNPNLFIRSSNSLVVLDHNLAFAHGFDAKFKQDRALHVSATIWFGEQHDLLLEDTYRLKLEAAFSAFDGIWGSLPDEWLEQVDGDTIKAEIQTTLARFNTPEFWEGLQ